VDRDAGGSAVGGTDDTGGTDDGGSGVVAVVWATAVAVPRARDTTVVTSASTR
jgi:hypothetical protein